ncbi:S41 family peptidase [Bacillus sp. 1P06AnD]|uniref:S41 family peptidase n=1 Tax=Bacillus sp. 1P06AnD TaxID=3132208 RepID=UPI0039A334A3
MFIDIFEEIIDIMHHDYAGAKDKQGWDHPEEYRQKIKRLDGSTERESELFCKLVKEYLLDFKDQHLSFHHVKAASRTYCGFKTRRYQNALYITESISEKNFQAGDKITALDGEGISELAIRHKKDLYGEAEERQNWSDILKLYNEATVEKPDGHARKQALKKYPVVPYSPQYSAEKLDNGIVKMTLTDFDNADAIRKLIGEVEPLLCSSRVLIMDVRINYGGADSAFLGLLPFIFPVGVTTIIPDDLYPMEMNYTKRNVELRSKEFLEFIQITEDKGSVDFFNHCLREMQANKGKGFQKYVHQRSGQSIDIQGRKNPEQIFILSDVACGSSGDSFVDVCKLSKKVTVVGRATAGLNDYANLAEQTWKEEFKLQYATSRMMSVDKGEGMQGKGIVPHVHIPWKPEHIGTDVDLLYCLEAADSSKVCK